MKIIEHSGIYEKIEEYDYTPSAAELYYWYSGTHAGIDRNNPYTTRYGMSITRFRYIPITKAKGMDK